MGYYTCFKLEYKDLTTKGTVSAEVNREIVSFLDDNHDLFYGIMSDESAKWYDHDEAMRQLSREFPSVLFTLSGEGEDSGDIWKKYFANGQVETDKATLTFKGVSDKFIAEAIDRMPKSKTVQLQLTEVELRRLIDSGLISEDSVVSK